ncbi:MAG: hypothetical protein ABFS08_06265 [Pseudomonadota bacterium]
MRILSRNLIVACLLLWPLLLVANEIQVVTASAVRTADTWRIDVTLRHADRGWEHYANKWEVLNLDGEVLGTRVLYHPHVDEQPFTRSLTNVAIPDGTKEVLIRAYDLKHGKGKEYRLSL